MIRILCVDVRDSARSIIVAGVLKKEFSVRGVTEVIIETAGTKRFVFKNPRECQKIKKALGSFGAFIPYRHKSRQIHEVENLRDFDLVLCVSDGGARHMRTHYTQTTHRIVDLSPGRPLFNPWRKNVTEYERCVAEVRCALSSVFRELLSIE